MYSQNTTTVRCHFTTKILLDNILYYKRQQYTKINNYMPILIVSYKKPQKKIKIKKKI